MEKRIMIATPTYVGLVPIAHTSSLVANVATLARNGYEILYGTTQRTFVHRAQNALAKEAMSRGADLFFLEEDVILHGDDFILRALDKPSMIVCGPQADRNGERKLGLFGVDWKPIVDLKEPTECRICHTGATLVRFEALEAVMKEYPEPFQANAVIEPEPGRRISVINDGSFMVKAIDKGFIPFAYPDLQVSHIGHNRRYTYGDDGYSAV